ncbi:MAG: hypothetical protein AB4038_09650 [Prochloraceae cyanobacterium]
MIFLTKEQLAPENLESSSQLMFEDKLFTRGPDFAKSARSIAIKFCQRYLHRVPCLLVDNDSYVSVWIEQTNKANTECSEQTYKAKTNSIEQSNKTNMETGISNSLEPKFIRYSEEKLSELIGPIASIICQHTILENPSMKKTEFVAALAEHIENIEDAIAFQNQFSF